MVEIMHGEGISRTGELLKIATDLDLIQSRGLAMTVRRSAKVLKMLRSTWQTIQKF